MLEQNQDQSEKIKANYNFLFNEERKKLKKKYRDEFNRNIRTNRSHSTLLANFLLPFIADKMDPKYEELRHITLLMLDPLYSENIKGLKTFDALIGCSNEENRIKKLIFIEAKSRSVGDNYNYEQYFTEKIKNLITERLKDKYPRLTIDPNDFSIEIFILIYEKQKNSWIKSLENTQRDIVLWSQNNVEPNIKYEISWKKNEELGFYINTISNFFEKNAMLKRNELEMSFSLDNLYNLDILRKNYISNYENERIRFDYCQYIFHKLARSDYFYKKDSEKEFFEKLKKIGTNYDVIFKKDPRNDHLYFRDGEDILLTNYIEKKLNENLYSNEEQKSKLMEDSVKF